MILHKTALRKGFSLTAIAMCLSHAPSAAIAAAPAPEEVRTISAEEKAIGAKAHPQLLQQFGGIYSGPQATYVERIGKNIAVHSGLGNARQDFTVTLLNSPVNNAFAVPGGYVYVTRQLMALMNDEAELAGVLGHEVGHVAARHSERRQKKARRNSILGVLGQIGSGLLFGDTVAGRLGQELFGTGSQLLTLRYSRKQEYEADDLGVEYLTKAGYDPHAVSSMLYSLALQNSLDARASGSRNSSVPTWASTHPNPAKRVSRADKKAGNGTGSRNRDAFLNQLDNMTYGQDRAEGVVIGSRFLHPEIGFAFDAPRGYTLNNGSSAVTIQGQGGQAQLSRRAYAGNLNNYVGSVFNDLAKSAQQLSYGPIERTTINGLPVAYASARVGTGRNTRDVTVLAYELSQSRALHFVTITPAGRTSIFGGMFNSMRPLMSGEAAAIKNRRVKVITVQSGDTISNLASRMAFDNLQEERFRTLNGLSANEVLRPGQRLKLVTY